MNSKILKTIYAGELILKTLVSQISIFHSNFLFLTGEVDCRKTKIFIKIIFNETSLNTQNRHIIGKEVFHLELSKEKNSFRLQQQISRLCREKLHPGLEKLFDEHTNPEELIRIDYLEIDLGEINYEDLEGKLVDEVLRLLKSKLKAQIQQKSGKFESIPVSQNLFEHWLHFLEYAHLPWQANIESEKKLRLAVLEAMASEVKATDAFKELLKKNNFALERLILQHPENFLKSLLEAYGGKKLKNLFNLYKEVKKIWPILENTLKKDPELTKKTTLTSIKANFWRSVFRLVVIEKRSPEPENVIIALLSVLKIKGDNHDFLKQLKRGVNLQKRSYPILSKLLGKFPTQLKEQTEDIERKSASEAEAIKNKKDLGKETGEDSTDKKPKEEKQDQRIKSVKEKTSETQDQHHENNTHSEIAGKGSPGNKMDLDKTDPTQKKGIETIAKKNIIAPDEHAVESTDVQHPISAIDKNAEEKVEKFVEKDSESLSSESKKQSTVIPDSKGKKPLDDPEISNTSEDRLMLKVSEQHSESAEDESLKTSKVDKQTNNTQRLSDSEQLSEKAEEDDLKTSKADKQPKDTQRLSDSEQLSEKAEGDDLKTSNALNAPEEDRISLVPKEKIETEGKTIETSKKDQGKEPEEKIKDRIVDQGANLETPPVDKAENEIIQEDTTNETLSALTEKIEEDINLSAEKMREKESGKEKEQKTAKDHGDRAYPTQDGSEEVTSFEKETNDGKTKNDSINQKDVEALEEKAVTQKKKSTDQKQADFPELQKISESPIEPVENTTSIRHEIPEPPIGSEYYIQNAGVVLLNPFFVNLFRTLKLIEGKDFIDEIARTKAIHMVQFLATGNSNLPEYELILPKFLCSLPFEFPLEREIKITKKEKTEADKLLKAALDHWGALGDVSPDSLREGFLQREGKLEKRAIGWYLLVEQKTIDILLDKLPWGFSMIKLPWMKDILRVEWA